MIVQRVSNDILPSPYSDHVLIERLSNGSFSVSGCVRHQDATEHLSLPVFENLELAIAACEKWADRHAILVVHVHARLDESGRPHERE